MSKVAFITGIAGQDGSYLAELLLDKDYEVHGMIRRSSLFNTGRIDHIFHKLHLHYGDMTDGSGLQNILSECRPDEIYNLAAQSHVKVSFETPEYTSLTDGIGVLKLLEAVRSLKLDSKIYQAGTSEMYGHSPAPQHEKTAFQPCSPYGTAKLYAHNICKNYRESYGMFVSNGILFNHESPRRGETFVTRKVIMQLAKQLGHTDSIQDLSKDALTIGNIHAKRDWGHAKDYVRAMWMMLQHDKPDDFVIATGKSYTVKEMINYCYDRAGVPLQWDVGDYVAYDSNNVPRVLVESRHFRPNEVPDLQGLPIRATHVLGWKPEYTFETLMDEMLEAEGLRCLKK